MPIPKTVTIVVYCATCDYFLKVAVQQVGTHGCAQCGHPMEVYVPQEYARWRDHVHTPTTGHAVPGAAADASQIRGNDG